MHQVLSHFILSTPFLSALLLPLLSLSDPFISSIHFTPPSLSPALVTLVHILSAGSTHTGVSGDRRLAPRTLQHLRPSLSTERQRWEIGLISGLFNLYSKKYPATGWQIPLLASRHVSNAFGLVRTVHQIQILYGTFCYSNTIFNSISGPLGGEGKEVI